MSTRATRGTKLKRTARLRQNASRRKSGNGRTREDEDRFRKVFEKIYKIVLRIPRGRVMTYGQIAILLEGRYSPRLVGWAMHATPKDARNIPWHRVINSKGGISTGRVILQQPELQRLLLEEEGVTFDERGRCDLLVYQWSPRTKRPVYSRLNGDRSNRPVQSKKSARKKKNGNKP